MTTKLLKRFHATVQVAFFLIFAGFLPTIHFVPFEVIQINQDLNDGSDLADIDGDGRLDITAG